MDRVRLATANFYIANGYYCSSHLRSTMMSRRSRFQTMRSRPKVYGIPCADLVWGQGSIHCVTQQLYG